MKITHKLKKFIARGDEKEEVKLLVTHHIELTCQEYILLRKLVDEFVDCTAKLESEAYRGNRPDYEYRRDRHALGVHLRNKFVHAQKDVCASCTLGVDEE